MQEIKVCFGADDMIQFDCPYIVHVEQKEKTETFFFLEKKQKKGQGNK